MPVFPNFVGGSYTSRSLTVAADRCVNLVPEVVESQTGKNVAALYGTPGLAKVITLPTSPIRAITVGSNRLYVVSGSHYYWVQFSGSTYTYNDRGSIGAGTDPCQVVLNGTQAMIVNGTTGEVWIDTGTALVKPLSTPAQGYINTIDHGDGYGYASVQLVSITDQFDTSMVGGPILIGDSGTLIGTSTAVQYQVAAYIDPWNIRLTAPAGVKTNAPYWIPQGGTVASDGAGNISYNSGDVFVASMLNQPILINGITYTVTSVDPPYHLTVSPAAPVHLTDRVPYAVSLPVLASCGTMLDGYFVIAYPESTQISVSAVRNGLHWDPADTKNKEAQPDNISMILTDHEELYIFGTTLATEVWRDTGAADFPFERDLGGIMQMGCIAPWSVVKIAQGVAWVGGDASGNPVCYRAQGFTPVRISTHAVENAWEGYSKVTDAEAFVYTIDGHETLQVNFPTANATWCWDARTQLWYEKQYGTGGRHRARFGAECWGSFYAGDYNTGDLYRMANDLYTDDGTQIVHIRRCPHLSQEEKRLFFSSLRIDMEPVTAAFDATLSWSNDGGMTFNTPLEPSGELVSGGTPGHTIGQEWRRLGSGRDRVFELKIWGNSRIAVSQAYLNTV